MLKSVFCRFNSISTRDFVRVTRNLSAIGHQQSSKENGRSNNKSNRNNNRNRHAVILASVPTFLAFFQKKENEQQPEPEPSLWEKILPEEFALLIKSKMGIDESTPELKLTATLKRTILAIHRQQYDKAEQMGHLALRMAQDIQHYDGITLCYDTMGNLAFVRKQYEKAEKLFESVLQRLLEKGVAQDDLRVLHLSLKVAQLTELQGKTDEAKTNYVWTLSKLDEKLTKEPNDQDVLELKGLTNNYYSKFLSRQGRVKEALERMKLAQEIFVKVRGAYEPEHVDILNNLAVLSLDLNDYDSALAYIDDAIVKASAYPDLLESGIYHANKGLICLKKGLIQIGEKFCQHAEKLSHRSDDPDGKAQAKYCMDEYQKFMNLQEKN